MTAILVPVVSVILIYEYSVSLIDDALDWLSSSLLSLFGLALDEEEIEQRTEEWRALQYPNFEEYSIEEVPLLNYAKAISCYYYIKYDHNLIAVTGLTYDEYIENFKTGSDSNIVTTINNLYGLQFDEDDITAIRQLADSFESNESITIDTENPLGTESVDYSRAETLSVIYPILNQASAQGGFSYSPSYQRNMIQCVDISRYFLWVKWGVQSGGGNGRHIVQTTYNINSSRFTITHTWTAGTIFSVYGLDSYGHTGYVDAVDLANGMVCLTEAWGSNYTVHVKKWYTLSYLYSYYGTDWSFLVPK